MTNRTRWMWTRQSGAGVVHGIPALAQIISPPGLPIMVACMTPHVCTLHCSSRSTATKELLLSDILDTNDALSPLPGGGGAARTSADDTGLPPALLRASSATSLKRIRNFSLRGRGEGGDSMHAHTLPSLVNVPASGTYTFAAACKHAWKEATVTDESCVTIFRCAAAHDVHRGRCHRVCCAAGLQDIHMVPLLSWICAAEQIGTAMIPQ